VNLVINAKDRVITLSTIKGIRVRFPPSVRGIGIIRAETAGTSVRQMITFPNRLSKVSLELLNIEGIMSNNGNEKKSDKNTPPNITREKSRIFERPADE
jgi:hypothetical protein